MSTKTIYNLLDFYEGITTRPDYKNVKSLIHTNGHMAFTFEDCTSKVFNPQLAVLFRQTSIEGRRQTITDKVFNKRLATLFRQTSIVGNRLTITEEPTLHEGQTTIHRHQATDEQPFSPLPLFEAYCKGYQAGRAEMEKRYPNPPQAAKDLKVVFEKLLHIPNRWQHITNVDEMTKLGRQAGQYSMILDWLEQYPETLKAIATRPESKPKGKPEKHLPDLRDIIVEDYYPNLIKRLQTDGDILHNRNTGQYIWQRSLYRLGGLHYKLKKQNKLTFSGTNQEAGRIFCSFFNKKLSNEKAFQPSQAATQAHHFNWITNFLA